MRRLAVRVALLAALGYVGICAVMFAGQRSLIYHPTAARDLPGVQALALTSGSETLRVWSRPADGKRALVYFGGNHEDVAGAFEEFARAVPDRALYFANYRGYGGSSGSPSEQGLFADALAMFDWAAARHPGVAVVGRSLGTGVAVHVARERPVERLVLVTPYDSIENVARSRYPFLPVAWLLKDKFDSAARAPGIAAPTLLVVAEDDFVIPAARTEALAARFAAGVARVEVLPGTGHNSIGQSPRYLTLIGEFLDPERPVRPSR